MKILLYHVSDSYEHKITKGQTSSLSAANFSLICLVKSVFVTEDKERDVCVVYLASLLSRKEHSCHIPNI